MSGDSNFFATKKYDDAVVLSAQYRVSEAIRVFGEYTRYRWGLTDTSAQLLDLDIGAISKPGYYIGTDVSAPVAHGVRVGTTITREELTRDDSLISYLSLQGFDVALGTKERSAAFRLYADFSDKVTIAVIRNNHTNPYLWVSGIEPILGPSPGSANTGSDKWGLVVRLRVQ